MIVMWFCYKCHPFPSSMNGKHFTKLETKSYPLMRKELQPHVMLMCPFSCTMFYRYVIGLHTIPCTNTYVHVFDNAISNFGGLTGLAESKGHFSALSVLILQLQSSVTVHWNFQVGFAYLLSSSLDVKQRFSTKAYSTTDPRKPTTLHRWVMYSFIKPQRT